MMPKNIHKTRKSRSAKRKAGSGSEKSIRISKRIKRR